MKNTLLIALICFCINFGNAQVGISAGTMVYKSAFLSGAYPGLHFGVEVPRDDMISFFGRMAVTLPKISNDTVRVEAVDPSTTFPGVKDIPSQFKNSVTNFQFGTRYYVGNGYDYGISAYGGSIMEFALLTVKREALESYDESKYAFISSDGQEYSKRGSIFLVNLGLTAGVKYNFFFGVIFLDFTGSYNLFPVPTNALARDYGRASPLNFTANLGFRKDIYR